MYRSIEQMVRALAPLHVTEAHPGGVWAICPCPANRLVTGGGDGSLKAWEVESRTGRLHTLDAVTSPHTEVLIVHRSKHGALISAGHHGGLCVWEWGQTTAGLLPRQQLTLSDDREEHTDRLLETQAGHLIAWVSGGRTPPSIWVWSEAERSFRFQQHLPVEQPCALLELPSGDLLSGDESGRLVSWRWNEATAQWQAAWEFRAHEGPIHVLTWTQDGTLLSAGGDAPLLRAWQWPPTGILPEPQQVLTGHTSPIVSVVESGPAEFISNDRGERLLLFFWRHRPEMRVWRKGGGGFHVVQRHEALLRRTLKGILFMDEGDGSLRLWRKTGDTYEPFAQMTGGHQGRVLGIESIPEPWLVTGGVDGTLALWSLAPFTPED